MTIHKRSNTTLEVLCFKCFKFRKGKNSICFQCRESGEKLTDDLAFFQSTPVNRKFKIEIPEAPKITRKVITTTTIDDKMCKGEGCKTLIEKKTKRKKYCDSCIKKRDNKRRRVDRRNKTIKCRDCEKTIEYSKMRMLLCSECVIISTKKKKAEWNLKNKKKEKKC